MKTKFYSVALLASAALITPAQAGGHHGGGGGNFAAPQAAAPAIHSAPFRNFGGGRFMASGQRFSSIRVHSPNSFRPQRVIGSNAAGRRFDGSGTLNHRDTHLARHGNDSRNRLENRGANVGRQHVFGQRSADWHRDWDRRHDHWWHGHRCRFVNGFWFIYDFGFDPYNYWYPYDYYAYDPYEYDPGAYQGEEYYGESGYESADQYANSTMAAAQEQLARQGYYRENIDGILGPETHRAIARYQSNHGLRVTGALTIDTLRALGLNRVASYQ